MYYYDKYNLITATTYYDPGFTSTVYGTSDGWVSGDTTINFNTNDGYWSGGTWSQPTRDSYRYNGAQEYYAWFFNTIEVRNGQDVNIHIWGVVWCRTDESYSQGSSLLERNGVSSTLKQGVSDGYWYVNKGIIQPAFLGLI
jgi:hypothetical protein